MSPAVPTSSYHQDTLNSLLFRFKELKSLSFYLCQRTNDGTGEFIFLDVLQRYIESKIEEIELFSKNLSSIEDSVLEHQAQELKQEVQLIKSQLTDIHKPASTEIPSGTVCLVKSLFDNQTTTDVKFFLNISSLDYSISFKFFDIIRSKVFKEDDLSLCRYLMQINFLPSDKKDVLRNCIFGHEVGHGLLAVDEKFKNFFNITFDKIFKLLLGKFPECALVANLTPEIINRYNTLSTLTKNWLEEFLCDLICVHSLGPAGYFSMQEIIYEEHSPLLYGSSHPPFFLRSMACYKYLDKIQLLKCVNSGKEKDLIVSSNDHYEKIVATDDYVIFFRNNLIDVIVDDFIKENLPGRYLPERYQKFVKVLNEYFHKSIAPAEVLIDGKMEEIELVDLVNAGWSTKLQYSLEATDLARLGNLIDKSLVNTFIKRHWNK